MNDSLRMSWKTIEEAESALFDARFSIRMTTVHALISKHLSELAENILWDCRNRGLGGAKERGFPFVRATVETLFEKTLRHSNGPEKYVFIPFVMF